MTIETLIKLRELGYFDMVNKLGGEDIELNRPDDNDIKNLLESDNEFILISFQGFIRKFFIEKYNLLGNVYSNASGYLWEAHDAIGGTHRINSDFEGDQLDSGTYSSHDLAFNGLVEGILKYIAKKK